MPIYEFYCSHCHTLLNFFSARVDTESQPSCPHCQASGLPRRPARFATLKHREDEEPGGLGDLDEERMAGVMEALGREMEKLGDSEDPRQLASLFRQFGDASGLRLGAQMEEYLSRLEAGADPDQLEQEMDTDLDDASMADFFEFKKRLSGAPRRQPRVDDTLYFL